jgi:CBS domain-containing protein
MQNHGNMKVKDIMTRDVKVIRPDAKLKDAARMMDDINTGALPVCDGDKLVGLITDRDIIIRSIAAGEDPNQTPVSHSMTAPIEYCYADQDIHEAARIMKEKQIRRLVVLDRDKRLVGVIALGDLAAAGSGGDRDVITEVLERVSQQSSKKSAA